MSSQGNSEILDLANLVCTADEQEFTGLSEDVLKRSNDSYDLSAQLIGGSTRMFTAFDPASACNVQGMEFYGTGLALGGLSSNHFFTVRWHESEKKPVAIDLDTGAVFTVSEEFTPRPLSSSEQNEYQAAIVSALGALAEKSMGL